MVDDGVEVYLDDNFSINYHDVTPLTAALLNNSYDAAKLLFDRGAKVNTSHLVQPYAIFKDMFEKTQLGLIMMLKHPDPKCVKLLIRNGADILRAPVTSIFRENKPAYQLASSKEKRQLLLKLTSEYIRDVRVGTIKLTSDTMGKFNEYVQRLMKFPIYKQFEIDRMNEIREHLSIEVRSSRGAPQFATQPAYSMDGTPDFVDSITLPSMHRV